MARRRLTKKEVQPYIKQMSLEEEAKYENFLLNHEGSRITYYIEGTYEVTAEVNFHGMNLATFTIYFRPWEGID